MNAVRGALLTTAISAFVLAPLWRAFATHPHSIHTTIFGDQAFHMWAIERARHAASFSEFVVDCDLSTTRCFDLRRAAFEWPSFYVHGKVARLFGLESNVLMSLVYYTSPLLNALAAFAFVGTVSREWLIAGAVGPLVGFQLSPLFRLRGHLCLVYVWPLVLSLSFWWLVLVLFSRRDAARTSTLLLCSFGFACSWTLLSVLSYYYFAFSLPLLSVLTIAFFAFRMYEPGFCEKALPGRLAIALGPPALACIAIVSINAHAMVGRSAAGLSLARSVSDVLRYSPELRDYFVPYGVPSPTAGEGPFESAAAFPLFRALGVVQTNRQLADRGEVFAFLGATALGLFLATAIFFAVRAARRRGDFDLRRCATVATVGVVAGFLGTAEGGRYFHALVPALRCFNRMAPFVVLSIATLAAVIWAQYERAARAVAVVVALSSLAEFRGYATSGRLLDPANLWDLTSFRRSAGALSSACADGALRVEPPIVDYTLGPYWKLLASEIARCRLDDVGGPGTVPTPSPVPVAGIFRDDWSVAEP